MTVPPLAALGGSAGAIEALRTLLPAIEPASGMAVAIILHRQPVEEDQRLARVLGARSRIPVTAAIDGEPIVAGRAVVCPAGVHLTVNDGHYALSTQAKENGSRPSVDVFFRSAAADLGDRVVGVVLSGLLDDGRAGIAAIRAHGGTAIAQEPEEALFGDMPRNAIEQGVDAVLPSWAIAEALERFASRIGKTNVDKRIVEDDSAPSPFACPDCHGVMWETRSDGATTYRCRTGHRYSAETLQSRQEESVEDALWAAIRGLEEQADLSMRAALHLRSKAQIALAVVAERRSARARSRADIVRKALQTPIEATEDADATTRIHSSSEA